MATLTPVIQKKSIRKDGTWNVKIKLGHKCAQKYIDTRTFVEKSQLDKNFKIKDLSVLAEVHPEIKEYTDLIKSLGSEIDAMSANELRDRLISAKGKGPDDGSIDFKAFCEQHIRKLINTGRDGSAKNMQKVLNSLNDYFKTPRIPITSINYAFLVAYEVYLRRPRTVTRPNLGGRTVTTTLKPNSDAGIHSHMRDLRCLFNEARNYYNDEDLGIMKIMHYPFKKYKVGSPPLTENRNLSISDLIKIRDITVLSKEESASAGRDFPHIVKDSRAELARDLCMLSFYLLGMNAADLYQLPEKNGDRVNYNRAKTKNKRMDKAFISIKVIDEAKPLLKKYAGKLKKRYSSVSGLNAAIDIGLKVISEQLEIKKLDFYSIRHSVGTLGRNVCGFSFEDIAIALNQKERTVTDIYIAADWSTVDKVQKSVTDLLVEQNTNLH